MFPNCNYLLKSVIKGRGIKNIIIYFEKNTGYNSFYVHSFKDNVLQIT